MRETNNQSQWIGGHSLGRIGSGKQSWFSFSLIHSYSVYGAFRLKDCDLWEDSLQEESQIPPGWFDGRGWNLSPGKMAGRSEMPVSESGFEHPKETMVSH